MAGRLRGATRTTESLPDCRHSVSQVPAANEGVCASVRKHCYICFETFSLQRADVSGV